MRELLVIIKYAGVSKEIWKVYGSHGRKWIKASVDYASPTPYNVRIYYNDMLQYEYCAKG